MNEKHDPAASAARTPIAPTTKGAMLFKMPRNGVAGLPGLKVG